MLMTSEINQPKCRIYLISPPSIDINEFPKKLRSALKGGDVACLQLRLKNLPDDEVRKAAEILIPICHELNVAFIVNDNPVIAAEVGADGVHIGTDDAKYNDARKIVGDDNMVEIYINTSIEECERRDVKGLYKKARKGEIKNMTGISAPYESPLHPDIQINTEEVTIVDATKQIINFINPKLILQNE